MAGWNCTLDAQFGRCASVTFAASTDGARTFGTPTTVNPPSVLDQDIDNSQPVVSANTISIAHRHGHRTNPEEPDFNRARFDSSLVLGASTDGGATWSTSTIRLSFTPARGFVDPVLAADPRDGGLYVTYEEKVDQITLPPPQQPQSIADNVDAADTARLIAQAMDNRNDADKTVAKPAFPAAVVVNPTSIDAAAAAGVAASLKVPLLFSEAGSVPASTTEALRVLAIPRAIVVGTTTSITDAAMASLPAPERTSPADLAARAMAVIGSAPVGPVSNVVYVTSSERAVEAGVVAAAASRLGGRLLVVPGGTAAATKALASANLSTVDRLVVVGHTKSRSWSWPLLILVGMLAVVGAVLLVLARRRRTGVRASPAGA